MSDCFHVATRKGLFTVSRSASGWKITQLDFAGENASMVLHDHRDGHLYVALNHGHFGTKLHRSADNGATWEECAVPVYPEYTEADAARQAEAGEFGARRDFSKLHEIWELTPGGADQPGLLWAGTIPGGLFRSSDAGESWTLVTSLWDREDRWQWFGGGKDSPGIHSITVHPQDSQRLMVAISCGGAWLTMDGGESWEPRSTGMRSDYLPPEEAGNHNAQDPHRMVQCPASPDSLWIQHHNGIFRTTDGGAHWHEIENVKPSVFGFAVAVHPEDPDTAWFVPGVKDECRIPVDGRLAVNRTRDGGKNFEALTGGLPERHCYDLVYRHGLDVDRTGDRLIMGSTTGSVWVSENSGADWQCVSTHLPPVHCVRFAHLTHS